MKQVLFLILVIFTIVSCQETPKNQTSSKLPEAIVVTDTSSMSESESVEENNDVETFYIVQVAEGKDFETLYELSKKAASVLGSKVDMQERIYVQDKGIIVPENSDDDIYSGEYYPRRPFDDQNFLSIEMAYAYKTNEKDTLKMIVLANIFENKAQSDSVVKLLLPKFKEAKTLKSELFMGCMH
jgi:hypothetical protein